MRKQMRHPDRYTDVVEVTTKLNRQSEFDDYLTERLYELATDPYENYLTMADPSTEDRYYLVEAPDGVLVIEPDGREWEFAAAVVHEDSMGFVDTKLFATIDGAREAWADIKYSSSNW